MDAGGEPPSHLAAGGGRGSGLASGLGGGLFDDRGGAGEVLREEARRLLELGPRLLESSRRFFAKIALPEEPSSIYAPRRRFHSLEDLVAGDPESLEEI